MKKRVAKKVLLRVANDPTVKYKKSTFKKAQRIVDEETYAFCYNLYFMTYMNTLKSHGFGYGIGVVD
jgi:hypothetical protein